MSQNFRLRFDEIREGNPTRQESESADDIAIKQKDGHSYYVQPGQMRNVCFVWLDGTEEFFPYSFLVRCRLKRQASEHVIEVTFTSGKFEIRGFNLKELHKALMEQRAQYIRVQDKRYLELNEDSKEPFATAITELVVAAEQ